MPGREASSYAATAARHAPAGPGDRASGQSGEAGHRNALRYEDSRNARSVMARIIQSMEAPSRGGPASSQQRATRRPAHKDVRFRCWTVECVREDVLGRLGT